LKQLLKTIALATGVVVLMGSAGAGATGAPVKRGIDVSSPAAIKQYLRSIGVSARGVVIQRGLRNYAGARCPGKRWTCTSTSHPVVQVAPAGGKNSFQCTTASCAVVQVAAAPSKPNKATCIKTTGISGSCSITQSSATDDNMAVIYQKAEKLKGLTQSASYTASITQTATGESNKNRACVSQDVAIDASTNVSARKGTPVTVTLRGHQGITITQNSFGGNSAAEAATLTGGCTGSAIFQNQALSSTAYGTGPITQLQNDKDDPVPGPNLTLVINQNQRVGYLNVAGGTNTMTFSQVNTQVADASGGLDGSGFQTDGPVTQTQGKPDGGIEATVNQFSTDPSTITANQEENQCAHAQKTGSVPTDVAHCFGVARTDPLPDGWTQTQHGPIRKGADPSTQNGDPAHAFGVTQTSTQKTDVGGTQNNAVDGDCTTTGNCDGTQTVKNNNGTTLNGNAGTGEVTFSTACTSGCTTTANFPSGNILVSVGNGQVQMWKATGGTTPLHTFDTGTASFTTGLAFDSVGNLYVTDFGADNVSRFNTDGTLAGFFGSGYNASPESIVFDSSDNAYVGQADGDKTVLKFSSTGAALATFSPAIQARGTDWIDLAADQCTLYYTSEGTSVKRFDVCEGVQLADFAMGLPQRAFAVKVLPDGGALVADTDAIRRLNSDGVTVQSYGLAASAFWFSLALDPSGTSFWAGDSVTGDVKKFDLSSGEVLASFNTGVGHADSADGIAVAP
jgi:hypothetical protein